MRTWIAALALFGLGLSAVADELPRGLVEGHLKPEKKKQEPLDYCLYFPKSLDASKPIPLIVGLHAGRNNGAQFAKFLRYFAEGRKAIVACPTALQELIGVDGFYWRSSKAEVAAIERFVAYLKKKYPIDPKRITAIGVADGAEAAATWALSGKRGLQGLCLINFLWQLRGSPRAKLSLKVYLTASRDAMEGTKSLKKQAERAYQTLKRKKYPVILRIQRGKSRSMWHGWDSELAKCWEWFEGKRDWPAELAAPPPPPK